MSGGPAVQPPSGNSEPALPVVCPGCKTTNAAGRKFCTQCGKALWDTCPQCSAMVTATDRYCGTCGADLVEGVARQAETLRQAIARAEDFCRQMDYQRAIQELTPVTQIRNTAVGPLVEQARQRLQRALQQQKSLVERLDALEEETKTLLASQQYRQVVQKIEVVPPAVRTPKLAGRLAEATARLEEIDSLSRHLRESAGASFSMHLVRTVGRLLELDPTHGHARQIMQRITRRVVSAAGELLGQRHYDEAARLLGLVPRVARSEELERLRARAVELARMALVLRTSPAATPALAALAERFCQLASQDPQAAAWRTEIASRLLQHPSKLVRAVAPAPSTDGAAKAGVAMGWLPDLPGVDLDAEMDPSVLRQHAGRFAVACGLALQGLEIGRFQLNLQPDTPTWFEKVWRRLNQRPARSAWGIDLGTAALKAVKLVYAGRGKPPRLAAADLVEHRKPLSQASGAEELAAIVEHSLVQLAGRNDLRSDRCCLGLPQSMLLFRRLEMPLADPQRMDNAVRYELKSQFPVPLAELVWDHVVAEDPKALLAAQSDGQGVGRMRKAWQKASGGLAGVLVLAAKRLAVKDILARTEAIDLRVDVIQAPPLALANLLDWGALESRRNEPAPPELAVAGVDLGCESMRFVAVAPGLLWFRQAGLGASRVAHFLARQHHVPLGRAEQWLRNPAEADSPATVLGDMETVFDDYCQELRESLAAFRAAYPQRRLRQVALLGGGMLMLGLLAKMFAADRG